MARDYKNITEANLITKKTRVRSKAPSMGTATKTLPIWLWLVSGVVIGGFVSFIVYLKLNISVDEDRPSATDSLIMKSPSSQNRAASENKAPEVLPFEFYNILPNREVVLPELKKDEKIEPTDQVKKQIVEKNADTKPTSKNNVSYIYTLQVGSFLKFRDADRHKANLAMLGIGSRIHAIKTNKITHYRVLVGPYENIKQINEIDTVMKSNNIKTLLLREKG